MSATLKIGGVLVTDPISIEWQPFTTPITRHTMARTRTKFPEARFYFNALTSAQFNYWASRCDNGQTYSLYFPAREDAAYTTNPETWSSTLNGFNGSYVLHMVSSRHSSGVYLYDAEIAAMMIRSHQDLCGGG